MLPRLRRSLLAFNYFLTGLEVLRGISPGSHSPPAVEYRFQRVVRAGGLRALDQPLLHFELLQY